MLMGIAFLVLHELLLRFARPVASPSTTPI
jgi:hypothetical protein